MIDIAKLDQNLAVSSALDPALKARLAFYDIDTPPFSIHGVFREGDRYVRLPDEVAQTVSEPVRNLCKYTAGGRVRFVTDSKQIAIHAVCPPTATKSHMPFISVTGFDLYVEIDGQAQCFGSFAPPVDCNGIFESVITVPEGKHTVTINMPLFNTVHRLYIGIEHDACLEAAQPLCQPPVVYYGSSITQGACASRPGNTYQAMLHRQFQTDYINLGFSGNAKAELSIMEYMAQLPMSMFVYDYDHNAPNVEHLQNTHYRGYQIIRNAHPDIPILLMTRPKYHISKVELQRNRVIYDTYEKAVAAGDKNIYFIDGRELFLPGAAEHSLIDNLHPTDLGFFGIYSRMLPLMQTLVK